MKNLLVTAVTYTDNKISLEQSTKHFFESDEQFNAWLEACPYTLTDEHRSELKNKRTVKISSGSDDGNEVYGTVTFTFV